MLISENAKVTITLGLVVALIGFVAVSAFVVGRQLSLFESRMVAVERSYIEHDQLRNDISTTKQALASQDVALAEIKTDLKWIRWKLESIK